MLVSENKLQYQPAYGIDLSAFMHQYRMNMKKTTCHLCCLFASKCFHLFESLNYSIKSTNIQHKDEKIDKAGLLSMDIWKNNLNEDDYYRRNRSPLFDIPLCFHKNFSSNHRLSLEEHREIKQRSGSTKVCPMKIITIDQ